MDLLPIELINIILEFQGYHNYRNGKYISRLNLNDPKYYELKRKPLIQKNILNNFYIAIFKKRDNIYTISTAICEKKVYWYMDVYDKIIFRNKNMEKSYHYVYEHN